MEVVVAYLRVLSPHMSGQSEDSNDTNLIRDSR
jgi:hypothetical protein